jgi:hypothetical protein
VSKPDGIDIELLPDPVRRGIASQGGLECSQSAVITVGTELFEEIWQPRTLDLLARSYWQYVEKRSRGLIRMREDDESRVVTSLKVPLLRFQEPEFETGDDFGRVTWPIDRGILVASSGRGQGYLRISVRLDEYLPDGVAGDRRRFTVTSEVANFYPFIRSSGHFARIGTWIYSQTQLRIHIAVTKGFLRSLEGLPLSMAPASP